MIMNWQKVLDILKAIGKFLLKCLKWVFKDIKNFLIVLFAILLLFAAINLSTTKKELERTKVELIESNDSIFEYKNKVGELYQAKETYIADINELKKVNEELYKEYKDLKDHPIIVEKIKTVFKIDSIYVKDSLSSDIANDVHTANFKYNDNWFNLSGATVFNIPNNTASTSIFNIEIPATFTTDVIEKSRQLYFLTKCDNPYIQINNIEGALISPEQSKVLKERFNRPWGVMVGVGPSVILQNNTVKIYPALHVTVGYKFISF